MTKNMQREFFFDELTARDVAERLRVRAEIDAYLNAVVLTTARLSGARSDERVLLNATGTGVLVISPVAESVILNDGTDGAHVSAAGSAKRK